MGNAVNQNPPSISVLMGVYNAEATAARAIDSILNQSFHDFEFLIVDDGSTDSTLSILTGFAARDSRIRVLRVESNGGLTRALNLGLSEAHAPLIARMDADDFSMPERLGKQFEAMRSNPSWLACGTDIRVVDRETGHVKHQTRPENDIAEALKQKNVFIHGSLLFRAQTLKDVGGYDEYFRLTQDYDLLLRLSRQGTLGWVSESLYEFTLCSKSLSATQIKNQIHYAAVAKTRHTVGARTAAQYNETFLGKLVYRWEWFRIWVWIYKCGLSLKKLRR